MKRITDKSFRYVPSIETNLKKTFDRVRREQAARAAEDAAKITPLRAPKKETKSTT